MLGVAVGVLSIDGGQLERYSTLLCTWQSGAVNGVYFQGDAGHGAILAADLVLGSALQGP